MSRSYPDRITQARELTGLTKTELAKMLDVTPAAVAQWESGAKHPTAENLAGIAHRLGMPISLLLKRKPAEVSHRGPLTFRAWSSAQTKKANRKARTYAELVTEVFLWLDERVSFPPLALPEPPENENGIYTAAQIIEVAEACRRSWALGDKPLLKLGELLESKGIVITAAQFDDQRFDAFSCIVSGRPFIFLGKEKGDRARSRFDAAHELGHLILHQHLTQTDLSVGETHKRVENEAHTFAKAFLMPPESFICDLVDLNLNGFLILKPKWGVSVQAMMRWARDLGKLSTEKYEELCRQVSMKGWRRAKGEPLDDMVPTINTSLGRRSFDLLRTAGYLNGYELPSIIPVPAGILCTVFGLSARDLEPAPELGKIIHLEDFHQFR